MQLRIRRQFVWVPDPSMPARFGGPAHLMLEPRDQLEQLTPHGWEPVPVVEDPVPPHPEKAR